MPGRVLTLVLLAALAALGCASPQAVITQQQEKLVSLGASTGLLSEGWLAGTLTDTYTKTAIDATLAQVEQQRAVLATPATLADARAARLSQQAEQLSRLLAQMAHDVDTADAAAMRQHAAAIPDLLRHTVNVVVELILGVVTSIGGFVEAGSISTAAQAGSEFHYQLLWAIAAATVMLAMLIEMSGRLAAVSKRSVSAAVREHFGWPFHFVPLAGELVIDLLLLAAEIGGVGLAVKLLSGVGFQWWIVPTGLTVWLIIWTFGCNAIEYGLGLLGLVTLSFVYAAWRLSPGAAALAHGLVPALPAHHHVRYTFLAVSIIGATVSPYILNFYSSGTVEEKMPERELWDPKSYRCCLRGGWAIPHRLNSPNARCARAL